MIPTIIDAAIILTMAFFTWRGARKGLILTLFSFVALFVAWFGAKAVAENFSTPVANIIRPSIELTLDEALEGAVPDAAPSAAPSPSTPAVVLPGRPVTRPADEPGDGFSLEQVLEMMEESELFTGLQAFVDEAAAQDVLEVTTTAAAAVAAYLADLIANALLFGLSFLLILLVWFLVSRALDLAFDLPILSAVNAIGGGILGLLKSVLLLVVVIWLARVSGVLTDEMVGPVAGLMTMEKLSELLWTLTAT